MCIILLHHLLFSISAASFLFTFQSRLQIKMEKKDLAYQIWETPKAPNPSLPTTNQYAMSSASSQDMFCQTSRSTHQDVRWIGGQQLSFLRHHLHQQSTSCLQTCKGFEKKTATLVSKDQQSSLQQFSTNTLPWHRQHNTLAKASWTLEGLCTRIQKLERPGRVDPTWSHVDMEKFILESVDVYWMSYLQIWLCKLLQLIGLIGRIWSINSIIQILGADSPGILVCLASILFPDCHIMHRNANDKVVTTNSTFLTGRWTGTQRPLEKWFCKSSPKKQ